MYPAAPASPCINVCSLDADGNCVGCYRTIDEIACWGSMTPDEQRAVLRRAEGRRGVASRLGGDASGRAQAPK